MAGICPPGYVLLRDASYAVAGTMFAGLDAHPAVEQARKAGIDARFIREQLDEACMLLWEKIDESHRANFTGTPIFIYGTPGRHHAIVAIDPSKLAGAAFLRKYTGGTPIFIRSSSGAIYQEFATHFEPPFENVTFLVRSKDLERICANLRRAPKRRASGSSKAGAGVSKRKELREVIVKIARIGKWSAARDSYKALNNEVRRESPITVSDKTIERAVKELASSGNDRFFRPTRMRSSSLAREPDLESRDDTSSASS